jgi:hypothetical protein
VTSSWLDDVPRRAREVAVARGAYPSLRYRRLQGAQGPVDEFTAVVDVPGYEARLATIEFSRHLPTRPAVYSDGPSTAKDSPHRYPDRGRKHLCIWYPSDPDEKRWVPDDGLLMLFTMAAEHLFKEAWWRDNNEWLGEEFPHDELTDGVKK